jgi:VanZ family protein
LPAPRGAGDRFAPPVVLMAVIFALSATPNLDSGLGTVDFVGRKIVHGTQYGLLWWLWLRAFGFRSPWPAAAITLAYAATDEFHQTFVEGRHGTVRDVGFDALGIPVAWAVDRRLRPQARRGA